MPEIKLTNVTKKWGKFYAVDHLNLTIEDNAFITLLGPSGCGKTTTLRMIAGLETPTSGRITIGDKVVFDSEAGINIPANKRKVGFLFQNYALWPNMTVYQNIAFGLSNIKDYTITKDGNVEKSKGKLSKEEIDTIVKRVSKVVKIDTLMDRYPAELSGGQQQRVAIARTLAPEPEVLFMDEPLSNLDAKLRLEMRYELQRLHVETGKTFVYVTHDQMEAMTLATKVCLINNGELQQYEAPLTIYNRPNNLFVADFVGNPSINFVDAKGKRQPDGSYSLNLLDGKAATLRPVERKAVLKNRIVNEQEEQELQVLREREEDYIVGIRPEYLRLGSGQGMEAEIYGAMPTGMESTVKLKVEDFLLTAVVFGKVMFSIGDKTDIVIKGSDILLYAKESGDYITAGELEF